MTLTHHGDIECTCDSKDGFHTNACWVGAPPRFDWKQLVLSRASYRVMQEVMRAVLITGAEVKPAQVMDYRAMLIKPDWTSVFMLVKIPRRMRVHSETHKTNLDFFTQIKGVEVTEAPAQPQPNDT